MQTFYTKLNDEAYFELPYISQSSLKHLADLGPAQHAAFMLEQSQKDTTDALRLGTVLHSLNLESTSIEAFTRFKRLDGRTVEGKAQKQAIAGLKSWVYEDEVTTLLEMRDLFLASFQAQAIMSKAQFIEHCGVVGFYNETLPEIFMKFKPDIVGPTFLADYKTIGDYATEDNIRRSIKSGDYSFQAACYLMLDSFLTGSLKKDFYFIFQETIKPYGVRVVRLDDYLLDLGYDRFKIALDKYVKIKNDPEKYSNPNYTDVIDIGLKYY